MKATKTIFAITAIILLTGCYVDKRVINNCPCEKQQLTLRDLTVPTYTDNAINWQQFANDTVTTIHSIPDGFTHAVLTPITSDGALSQNK